MDITEISRKYEDNILARVIVNAIPYVGSSLDIALSYKWHEYQSARIESLLTKISNELSDINDNLIDKDYIQSEEFYDLVVQIANNASKSRCEETRTGYARVIKSAMTKEENTADLESLVRQISELNQKDILFLKTINLLFNSGKEVSGNTLSIPLNSYRYSPLECELYLYRFENIGLLDHPRNMMTGRSMMKFTKTPLFDKIISYLNI